MIDDGTVNGWIGMEVRELTVEVLARDWNGVTVLLEWHLDVSDVTNRRCTP